RRHEAGELHPARKAAATHTRKVLALLEALSGGKGKGEDLLLLFEGAAAAAVKTGAAVAAAKRARAAAIKLMAR
ncbi:MAG TPA: hypothetical protein VD713_05650, partial [Sphingomonadales bacterium]|nr:hypothetical protein [Sphingomonadales bacterium]